MTDLTALAWMTGSWEHREGDVLSEEHWLPPRGGLMLGLDRTTGGDRPPFFEFLRIAVTERGITYFAGPNGRPPAGVFLVEGEGARAVFENPELDFPQRVLYWLDETGALCARIEGTSGGEPRSREWRWERAAAWPAPEG